MAILCISALSSGNFARRRCLLDLANGLVKPDEKISLLLYGDGVYNLVNGSQAAAELTNIPAKIYAIADDIANRGLAGRIIPQAQQVDYPQVVELIMEADHTITGV